MRSRRLLRVPVVGAPTRSSSCTRKAQPRSPPPLRYACSLLVAQVAIAAQCGGCPLTVCLVALERFFERRDDVVVDLGEGLLVAAHVAFRAAAHGDRLV